MAVLPTIEVERGTCPRASETRPTRRWAYRQASSRLAVGAPPLLVEPLRAFHWKCRRQHGNVAAFLNPGEGVPRTGSFPWLRL